MPPPLPSGAWALTVPQLAAVWPLLQCAIWCGGGVEAPWVSSPAHGAAAASAAWTTRWCWWRAGTASAGAWARPRGAQAGLLTGRGRPARDCIYETLRFSSACPTCRLPCLPSDLRLHSQVGPLAAAGTYTPCPRRP